MNQNFIKILGKIKKILRNVENEKQMRINVSVVLENKEQMI